MSRQYYGETPICPFCEHENRDGWEIDLGGIEGDGEVTCGSCGEEYFISRTVSVRYLSQKIKLKGDGDR